jgi:hypothetical protein
LIPIDEINNPPDPTNNPWELWELCPETFTLGEVMNWFWNGHDYTSTKIAYGRYLKSDGSLIRSHTWYLNYSEADAAWPDGTLSDIGQGLNFPNLGSARTIEPYQRVCSSGVRLQFSALTADATGTVFAASGTLISIRIVYDSVNDNYRFLVQAPYSEMGTEKYVENTSGPVNDTTTFLIPITASKNISVPMATRRDSGSSTYNFISTTTGSFDFYTYT